MTVALRSHRGEVIPLDVDRWRSDASADERRLLDGLAEPVLDIGCGPGRISAALAASGRLVLGIDPSGQAVAEARRRRAPVLQRSVFEAVPGEGRWATALLFDGNVGIGGDPHLLLQRVCALLRGAGEAVVEVEPPGTPTEELVVRLERLGASPSRPFVWARVGADHIAVLARSAGFVAAQLESHGGRWFARLEKP